MSIILISRDMKATAQDSLEILRFHGEYTTHFPDGLVRIGEPIPSLFFPDGARHWVVNEAIKNTIERELQGVGFDPVYCNRLIKDPGNQNLALARERHKQDEPNYGILDYFPDEDIYHKIRPTLFWLYIPLFGTGEFYPEVTQRIVDERKEAIFVDEKAYLSFVAPYLSTTLIERSPLFMIHSSLAMANWLYDELEPFIDKMHYQVTTLHGA